MASAHNTRNIRNIALVGHAGSGKTTLLEALLHKAGAISTQGSVDKNTTVSDFTEREQTLGHSLDAAVCHLDHDGTSNIDFLRAHQYAIGVHDVIAQIGWFEVVCNGVHFSGRRVPLRMCNHACRQWTPEVFPLHGVE